jgi:dipeptide/tripeptide permease
MQALNPALVMLIIPFNNLVLWPYLRRMGREPTQIQKMNMGIAFAGIAWVIVGSMQLVIDGGTKFSIVWQVLPYFFLTFGEVLVSATGLEFAYSQAPLAMKGAIMSFWNLAVTVGNIWVVLANHSVKGETITSHIKDTGISVTAFLMFFFAAFACAAAALIIDREVPQAAAQRNLRDRIGRCAVGDRTRPDRAHRATRLELGHLPEQSSSDAWTGGAAPTGRFGSTSGSGRRAFT